LRSGLADAVEAYQIGTASADAAHLVSTDAAESAYFVAMVTAERNQRVTAAQTYRDQIAAGDQFDSSAALQAISDAHTAATDDARQNYRLAATQANGVHNVARAAASTGSTKSTSTSAESWYNATAAAFADFASHESDAFSTKVTDIANLNLLFQTTQSQTLASDIALLATTNGTPAHTSAIAIEESIHTIAVANAKKDFDQTQAAAGATFVKAVSPASNKESQAKAHASEAGLELRDGVLRQYASAPKEIGPDDMIPNGISFDIAKPKYRQFKSGDDILEYTLEGGEITVDWVSGKNASSMMKAILDADGADVTKISGYVTDKLGGASNAALQRLGNQMAAQMGCSWKAAIETIEGRRYLVFTN
jgi:hypothetical protein